MEPDFHHELPAWRTACLTDNQHGPRDAPTPLPEPIGQTVDAARVKKANNLIVLDLRPSNAFTDYFVICSGRTTRQVKAIVDGIEERLKATGCRPAHVEGYAGADWVLIDCFDFIVHVFTPETRTSMRSSGSGATRSE